MARIRKEIRFSIGPEGWTDVGQTGEDYEQELMWIDSNEESDPDFNCHRISREDAAALIPILQRFVESGTIEEEVK